MLFRSQTKASEMYPSARGTAISAFALCLFCGQAAGVAIVGRVITGAGYAPSFIVTGVGLLVLAIWFSRQLLAHRTATSGAPTSAEILAVVGSTAADVPSAESAKGETP